jgi:hypothetical protein
VAGRPPPFLGSNGKIEMARCPICNFDVDEVEPGVFDGKAFRCPVHRVFEVSDTVLTVPAFMNAPKTQWEAALKKAVDRARNTGRPRILSYDFRS